MVITIAHLRKDMSRTSAHTEICDIQQWMDMLKALGHKWGYHIIKDLEVEALRFNELKHQNDSLSSSALSERLTALEEEGLVARTVIDTSPPAVSYSLTERGVQIGEILHELEVTWEQTE